MVQLPDLQTNSIMFLSEGFCLYASRTITCEAKLGLQFTLPLVCGQMPLDVVRADLFATGYVGITEEPFTSIHPPMVAIVDARVISSTDHKTECSIAGANPLWPCGPVHLF